MEMYREKLPYVAVRRRVRIGLETMVPPLIAAMVISPLGRIVIVADVMPVISRVADTPGAIDPEDTDMSDMAYLGSPSKNGAESLDSTPV